MGDCQNFKYFASSLLYNAIRKANIPYRVSFNWQIFLLSWFSVSHFIQFQIPNQIHTHIRIYIHNGFDSDRHTYTHTKEQASFWLRSMVYFLLLSVFKCQCMVSVSLCLAVLYVNKCECVWVRVYSCNVRMFVCA